MKNSLKAIVAIGITSVIFIGFQNFSPSRLTAQQSYTLSTLSDLGQQTRVAPNVIDTKGSIVRKISRTFLFDLAECRKQEIKFYDNSFAYSCQVTIPNLILPKDYIGSLGFSPATVKRLSDFTATINANGFNSYTLSISDKKFQKPGCVPYRFPNLLPHSSCYDHEMLEAALNEIKNTRLTVTANGLYEQL